MAVPNSVARIRPTGPRAAGKHPPAIPYKAALARAGPVPGCRSVRGTPAPNRCPTILPDTTRTISVSATRRAPRAPCRPRAASKQSPRVPDRAGTKRRPRASPASPPTVACDASPNRTPVPFERCRRRGSAATSGMAPLGVRAYPCPQLLILPRTTSKRSPRSGGASITPLRPFLARSPAFPTFSGATHGAAARG